MTYRRFLAPLFAVLSMGFAPATAQVPNAHYHQGVLAFEKKEFPRARDAFLAVIEKDRKISSDLLFNLGNTFFRLDQLGDAALWYRRAVLLDPTDRAARQNLRVVRSRAGFLEFEASALAWFARLFKHSHWQLLAIGTMWTSAVCLAAIIFLTPRPRWRTWLWGGFTLFLGAGLFALAGMWGRLNDERLNSRVIVVAPGVAALSAPTDTAGVVIDLPPGSEISLRAERDSWLYAELPGDRVGWVKKEGITRLWPYSPELVE
ncbi:MAG: tetratricopeptide repeat protein [Verrucomicrobiales bacterium]